MAVARTARRGGGRLTPVQRRWLLVVLAGAAALRIAWSVYAARQPVGLHDQGLYLLHASGIADGNGYGFPNGEATAYYPVGYPGALAGVIWLARQLPFSDTPYVVASVFNIVLGVLTVALVFELGRRLFDPTIGLVAAAVVAVWPNLVFHAATPMGETLFNALIVGALVVLCRRPWPKRGPDPWRLVAFGVLLALSALVRPISLLVLPLLAGVLWLATRRLATAAVGIGVVAVAVVVVIAPWTLRNRSVMGETVLISTNGGDNLCIGHHEGATGGFVLTEFCAGRFEGLPRPQYELRRNEDGTRKARRFAVEHPGEEVRLLFSKIHYLVRHDHDGLDAVESYREDPFIGHGFRRFLEVAADGFALVAALLGAAALPALASRRDPRRLALLAMLVAVAVAPLAFFGDPRFHVPVVPLLAIGTGVTVVRVARALAARRSGAGAAAPAGAS
jgi:4-amino-4-deoxy-L-arabinose transferase-like glycosyltransferase